MSIHIRRLLNGLTRTARITHLECTPRPAARTRKNRAPSHIRRKGASEPRCTEYNNDWPGRGLPESVPVNPHAKGWMEEVVQCRAPDAEGWSSVRGLSFAEAQELLDWLENQCVEARELTFDPAEGFSIRWRVQGTAEVPKAAE